MLLFIIAYRNLLGKRQKRIQRINLYVLCIRLFSFLIIILSGKYNYFPQQFLYFFPIKYKTRVLRKILPVKECLLYSMGSLVPDTVTDEYILSVKGAVNHPMM